jgi:hypothetical protein
MRTINGNRIALVAVLACAAGLLSTSPAAAAQLVSGTFEEPAPLVLTAYDLRSGAFSGFGASTWTGTWNGVTHWTIRGTTDLLTGDSSGTLDETFVGVSDDGGAGTLHFIETYTVDGKTATFYDLARLVGGTGDFAGARGHVTFHGLELPTGQGAGTYSGRWLRGHRRTPRRASSIAHR